MKTVLDQLRAGSQRIATPTFQTADELAQAVQSGIVIVQLENSGAYLGLYDTQWVHTAASDQVVFKARYRLSQQEIDCRAEIDRQTLHGWLRLSKLPESGDLDVDRAAP